MTDYRKVSALEITFKPQLPSSRRKRITNSQDSLQAFLQHWDLTQINENEQLKALYFDKWLISIGVADIATGTVDGVKFDSRKIYGLAWAVNARGIVLAHNHPGSKAKPSEQDIALTFKLARECKELGMILVDSLILTADDYYSFVDNNIPPMGLKGYPRCPF